MKIQCKLCKEISEIGPFRIEGDGIHVTCSVCREGFHVPSGSGAPAPAATERGAKATGPIDGPAMTCPKCDLAQAEAAACVQCGLRADKFGDFAGADDEQNQQLAAMFSVCESRWDDADAHERFAAAVSETSAFAYGAKRYRQAMRERPDDPTAKNQLDRLARMAEATLFTSAVARQSDEEQKEPYRGVVILIILLVVALAAGGYYVMTSTQRAKANRAAPPTLEAPSGLETNERRPTRRRGINKAPSKPSNPSIQPTPPAQPTPPDGQ